MFSSSANQWLKSTWNASAAFSSLHLSGWTRTSGGSGGQQSMTGLQSGSHLSSGHWGFINDSLGFIIKLVNPWHQFRSFRSSPCIPCRVSKCHTESLLYCLVISDSVASGATWWCSSNLSWRSILCVAQTQNPPSNINIKMIYYRYHISQHFSASIHHYLILQAPATPEGSDRQILDPAWGHRVAPEHARWSSVPCSHSQRPSTKSGTVRKCEKAQPKKAMAPGYSWPYSNSPAMKTIMLPRHSSGVPWLPSILRCHMESNIEIALRCQRVCFDHLWCMFTGRNQDSLVGWTRLN